MGALATTSIAATQAAFLKYSREDEEEADYLGLKYMNQSGYDRQAMISMLKKFRRLQGPTSADPPQYLLTHPLVEERTSELELQMARNPQAPVNVKVEGNLQRLQTKLQAEEKDVFRTVAYFENALKRRPDDPEGYFGLGLAQRRLGATDLAIESFSKAARGLPTDNEVFRELGIVYLLRANLPEAQKNLEIARSLFPDDAMTLFYLGRIFSEQKMLDEALRSFIRAKELKPDLPEVYYHLAQAYNAKGMLGPAYGCLGFHYKSVGNRGNALANFKRALPYLSPDSPEYAAVQKEIKEFSAPPPQREKPPPGERKQQRPFSRAG
jgi:beta-barrel assembly-enhancing protease